MRINHTVDIYILTDRLMQMCNNISDFNLGACRLVALSLPAPGSGINNMNEDENN
jgi:hypothetical protein